ncbi:MAG: DUF4252 domain-containing protein [Tenacibaculum sp.]|nr:DUF4252 domain-containing protein [Tenacibaculum sp.]
MKRKVLIAVMALVMNMGFAQSVFDKLENLDDVSTVVITKDAFDLLRKFPDMQSKDMKAFNAAKGLKELRVFSTEKASMTSKMENMVSSVIKSGKMTQLMRVKDKNSRVKIYVKSTKNKDLVSEVLMFVKNFDKDDESQSVIISLTGDINVNELSEIASDYEKKK